MRQCTLPIHSEAIPRNVKWQADPSGAESIKQLRDAGHDVLPCVHIPTKGASGERKNPKLSGIDMVSERIRTDRLKIIRCPGTMPLIREFAGRVPIFGVCLGHQALVEAFGGKVVRAGRLMHGKVSPVHHDGKGLFDSMPQEFAAGRYHSLIAEPATIPDALTVTATTAQGEIMGVRHRSLPIEGVQFHPESVLTPQGPILMGNFLKL